ncbi:hypothetical protein E0E52_20715 [Azotobacter chroococcum]|jgi:hypothetical protein|uniref:hypothetical protein n=1 Tax=Azotobacter chroococcum TaxID=353 RepID=UPI0010407A42|nr:hypothetical protein [Azotobacter chroococcum]TBW01552.1 hypothetical protein E0E52_20715 [Azotobacter chroococcum]
MSDEQEPHSWWQSLPGVLTALTGIITAVGGLVLAFHQAGFILGGRDQEPISSPISPPKVEARIDPQIKSAEPTASPLSSKPINLLAPENGGHLIVASGDDWLKTIDGKEDINQISYGLSDQREAVYAFKEEKLAAIESFKILINEASDSNVKEFELFAGSASPVGSFESLGVFATQNVKLFKAPYQEFKLQQVTARYLKIKILSTYGFPHPILLEVQAFGRIIE